MGENKSGPCLNRSIAPFSWRSAQTPPTLHLDQLSGPYPVNFTHDECGYRLIGRRWSQWMHSDDYICLWRTDICFFLNFKSDIWLFLSWWSRLSFASSEEQKTTACSSLVGWFFSFFPGKVNLTLVCTLIGWAFSLNSAGGDRERVVEEGRRDWKSGGSLFQVMCFAGIK